MQAVGGCDVRPPDLASCPTSLTPACHFELAGVWHLGFDLPVFLGTGMLSPGWLPRVTPEGTFPDPSI